MMAVWPLASDARYASDFPSASHDGDQARPAPVTRDVTPVATSSTLSCAFAAELTTAM